MFRAPWSTTLIRAAAAAAIALGMAACSGASNAPSSVAMASSTYSVSQGEGSVTLSVVRTGTSIGAVSVSYATADGTAVSGADYTAVSGTLQWAENDATPKSITVPVSDVTQFTGT